jgi:addiction module HigA family antidote
MEVQKMSRSSIITDKWAPVHPGEILMEDFIEGFGITQHKLAVAIGVPPRRINEIVHGKRRITADTALRLGRYFGVSAQFWLNLQSQYDLDLETDTLVDVLEAIEPLQSAS